MRRDISRVVLFLSKARARPPPPPPPVCDSVSFRGERERERERERGTWLEKDAVFGAELREDARGLTALSEALCEAFGSSLELAPSPRLVPQQSLAREDEPERARRDDDNDRPQRARRAPSLTAYATVGNERKKNVRSL